MRQIRINLNPNHYMVDKTNKYFILDHRLIYDSDSAILLELYSDGLVKENEILFQQDKQIFVKINYKLLKIKSCDLEIHNVVVREKFLDKKFIIEALLDVRKIFTKLWCETLKFEELIKTKRIKIEAFRNYYSVITEMMAFNRLAKFIEFDQKIDFHFAIPSHIMLFEDGLYLLQKKQITFLQFYQDYSFLYDYYITSNKYENEFLCSQELINKKYKFRNTDFSIIKNMQYRNQIDKLIFELGWTEEVKRILLQRGLRNLRSLMYLYNIDIHLSTAKDIEEKINSELAN